MHISVKYACKGGNQKEACYKALEWGSMAKQAAELQDVLAGRGWQEYAGKPATGDESTLWP
jgi:hypothetical protein